ncbi:hypothetical protein PVT01_000010900 [Plasmodium vivax]|uniref:PIR Superfamily Protein n=1 Tax=Plasmodium vivax TaxID=5855 RepID=A0A1G4E7X3_PLAVI|nr:hypothetical protein PVT01_000010900 [Plasmodium vivax]
MAPGEISDEYEFFENMDKNRMYKAVISVQNDTTFEELTEITSIIDCNKSGFNVAQKKTCKNFNKLISSLCSIKSSSSINRLLNDSDYYYLKLWFNLELIRNGAIGNDLLEEFSFSMYQEIKECFSKETMKNMLNDIEGNLLKKLKLLDNLYKNYFEIYYIFDSSSKEIRKCLEYSKECIKDYKTARLFCKNSNDNFYKALMKYKQTYKSLYDEATKTNRSNGEYIKKLPRDYEIDGLSFYTNDEVEIYSFWSTNVF